MASLTRPQLKTSSNSTYDTNGVGGITAAEVRTFNDDLIDSLITNDLTGAMSVASASNALTASSVSNGVLASLNSFTASATIRLNNLETTSASVNVSISNLNAATSSYAISASVAAVDAAQQQQINSLIAASSSYVNSASFAASQLVQDGRLNNIESTTASLNISVTNLNTFSASALVSISNINSTTASLNTSVTNLNSTTASLNTSASLALITASFDTGTRNLTFTKGNNTTFAVNIPDVSGSAGDFVTTSSFNSYTSSNDSKVNSLIAATGSYATTGSNQFNGNQVITGSMTSSLDIRVAGVPMGFGKSTGTSSIAIGVSTLLNNTGNSNIAIGTRAGQQNTTGGGNIAIALDALQNNTTGNQNIALGEGAFRDNKTGLGNTVIGHNAALNAGSGNYNTIYGRSAALNVKSNYNTVVGETAALNITSGSNNTIVGQAAGVDIGSGSNNVFIGQNAGRKVSGSNNTFIGLYQGIGNESGVIALSDGSQNVRAIYNSGWVFTGSVDIQNTLTASLQQGFTYVGNASGRTVAVSTSSFASTIDTGSFATTSSLNSYTASTNGRLTNIESTTASLLIETSNLETFSASALISISNLNASSASQQVSIDNLNTNSASVNTSITNINSATASLFTSASLALVTASASGNTITFTKGNSSTFSVSVDTGSAANTIFEVVYTGENITKGDPLYISGSQGANPIVFIADAADPNKMPVTFISNETIGASNTTDAIILGLIEGIDLTGYTANQAIYVAEGGGFSTSLPSGSNSITQLLGVVTKGGSGGKGLVLNPGPALLPGLDTGYMWVGNGNNQPIEITSASFVSSASFNSYTSSTNSRLTNIESTTASLNTSVTNLNSFTASQLTINSGYNTFTQSQETKDTTLQNVTSSLNSATASLFTSASLSLTTASFSGNTLTFTKGNGTTFGVVIPDVSGSTINTGSFATTGSNSFNGSQTITGSITTTQDITVSSVKFGFGNSAGTSSIAIGNSSTLQSNTGQSNIAIGVNALNQNVTGNNSVAIGSNALQNALANNNTGIGADTLKNAKANSDSNTAIGQGALENHFDGDTHSGDNMAFGLAAMQSVTSGSANTAIGTAALRDPGRANENVFIGWISGINASGSIDQNVVIGARAGQKLANSSNTIIGHNAGSNLINGGANTFIGQGAGALIITGSQNTLIGSIPGVDNWSNVIAIADGSSGIKTKFQSNIWEFTGSVDIQNTLTASLQQGYVWVGNSAGRTVTVATSSFGGGGSIDTGSFATTGSNTFTGDQTLIDAGGNTITLSDTSGSLMLVAKGFTSASAHLSSSAANKVNIIFKNNNNTTSTYISGSNNIFTNSQAATAGFRKQLGASNINIFNILPEVSASMGDYVAIDNNFITSRTANPMSIRGPISSSQWEVKGNTLLSSVSIGTSATNNAEKIVSGLNFSQNHVGAAVSFIANRNTLTQAPSVANNSFLGAITLNMASSSIDYSNNINIGNSVVVRSESSGSASTNLNNTIYVNSNLIGGNTTIVGSGSNDPNDAQGIDFNGTVYRSLIYGSGINVKVNTGLTGSNTLAGTAIIGNSLTVSGSSRSPLTNSGTNLGSAFFGRFNALDGNKALSSQTVFAVGTGTGTSAASRKTGFLIDSGSNTFVEGTLNVSGSSTFNGNQTITGSVSITGSISLNGNLIITGSLTASLQEGFVYVGNASGITTTVSTSSFGGGTIDTGSFATTGSNTFRGDQTITGSVSITGSLTTAGNMFQVTGSFNTFGNVITQLGVFTSSLAGGLEIDGIGYVGSGSAGGFFIGTTTQDLKIQNWYSSSVSGKNIVIENYSQTGSGGIHGKVALRARGDGGAVTVENTSQFRVECQTEITGSLIVSGSLAAANNIKMGRGTDKPTNKVTVGSGGLIVSNSLVTSDSYIFATNDTTVGNYSPVVSNITAGSFSLSNGGYGGNISVMYMIVNPY